MFASSTAVRRSRRPTRVAAAVAGAIVAVGLLAGCSNPIEDAVKQGVEDAIKDQTGADVQLDGATLPEGFPSAVALVGGEITVAMGTGDSAGWVVVVKSDESDPAAAAKAALEGAGFQPDTDITGEQLDALTGGKLDAAIYSNGEYRVMITVQDGLVSYTVAPL